MIGSAQTDLFFLSVLFLVAFLYSSVGHGGASGYLALMALWGFETMFMRTSALTLNLIVSSIAFANFYRGGYFRPLVLLPFVIGSIPLAWIGASFALDTNTYKVILGIFLLLVTARMIIQTETPSGQTKNLPFIAGLLLGAILGFFSGLIGIGGGIILSPLLILFRLSTFKEAAAIAAAFIFLNSASGLISIASSSGGNLPGNFMVMALIGATGGILGSWAGSFRIPVRSLKFFLAFVLLMASIKLLFVS